MPEVELSGGVRMPRIGYGVFQLADYDLCRRCVDDAIRCGYRLFDTAAAYFNEEAVGDAVANAVQRGEGQRSDFFLTTKVWLQDYGLEATPRAVEQSLRKLKTDYLDLVLLHQPFGDWQEAWKALEKLQAEGVIRAIGTSNFTEDRMDELLSFAKRRPQVNQIEIHPFYGETAYTRRLRAEGIQTEAWGPLNEGLRGIFRQPLLVKIGKNHGKSAAQAALRWNLQHGNVIIPKGTQLSHMKENLDILDFELSEEEMKQIDAMDRGRSEIMDFHSPATGRLLMKWKIHE